jgi:hypothetical protein
MNVRLVRSLNVDESVLSSVHTILRVPTGPASFTADKDTINMGDQVLTWGAIFSAMGDYRKQHGVPPDEFVVLVTATPNDANWFSAFDSRNIFVHTAGWEYYVACQPRYAIAYEVIDNIYQSLVFKSIEEMEQVAHDPPAGCINDMCAWKPDISLKFRTADICEGCLELSHQAELPHGFLKQMLSIFEEVRVHSLYSATVRPLTPSDSSLPFPIAFTKRKFRMTTEPLRKFLLLIDHFDSVLRTSTLMPSTSFMRILVRLRRMTVPPKRTAEASGESLKMSHWVAPFENPRIRTRGVRLPAAIGLFTIRQQPRSMKTSL